MKSIIYKMIHTPTGKYYIGSLKDSSKLDTYRTSSDIVSKMILDKPEDWVKEVLLEFSEETPFSEVVIEEQRLIAVAIQELSWDGVWNRFYHSGVSQCYSPEVIARKTATLRTPEIRKKMSESISKALKNPDYIKKLSDATVKQMQDPKMRAVVAKSNSERIHSDETRKRLSESHKGKKHSEETKEKMSNARLGRKFPRIKEDK